MGTSSSNRIIWTLARLTLDNVALRLAAVLRRIRKKHRGHVVVRPAHLRRLVLCTTQIREHLVQLSKLLV